MGRARFEPGVVIRIPLEDGMHTYGRMLEANPFVAYHDFRTQDETPDLLAVVASSVLFVLASTAAHAISQGEWTKAGKVASTISNTQIPPQFMQNIGNLNDIQLRNWIVVSRTQEGARCR
jgi:hypothetical protein